MNSQSALCVSLYISYRMGRNNSKPERPVESPFKEQPWRTIRGGWNESTRNELMSKIKSFDPLTLNLQTFNIILTGQVKSGKSSFYNSINSIFEDFVRPTKAAAGEKGRSFTKEFNMYKFEHNPRIRIGDTMGMEPQTSEADIRNILSVVDGHVPNGYKFNQNEEFLPISSEYIRNPEPKDRAHCVALVINANDTLFMGQEMVQNLKSLAEGLFERGIPIVVLLTHVDEFHPEVMNDITKTFHSRPLEERVDKVHNMVNGLPENQIYPVINYCKACDLDDNMDILLLYALRCMIGAAEDHLLKKKDQQSEKEATSHASP